MAVWFMWFTNSWCLALSERVNVLHDFFWNSALQTLFLPLKVKATQLWSNSLRPQGLYSPWNSPGQHTGVDSLSLLRIPTQGSNPGLPHCRQILYQLGHKGSSRILEWVAYPFSSRSSQPRNWTRVSCILACCGSWGRKESDMTEWLNWTAALQVDSLLTELPGSPFLSLRIFNWWPQAYNGEFQF